MVFEFIDLIFDILKASFIDQVEKDATYKRSFLSLHLDIALSTYNQQNSEFTCKLYNYVIDFKYSCLKDSFQMKQKL